MQSRKSFREIAKECNVSPATVSRIANGIGSFKSETKELVMSHLLREGYMLKDPDEEARLRNIALAVTDLSNEIFCKIISHIRDELMKKGCLLSIYLERDNQEYLIKQLLQSRTEGILFLSSPYEALTYDLPVPCVHILGSERCSITYNGKKYSVSSDDYVGGQLAAMELLRSGCKKPLILNSRYMHSSVSPRVQGFMNEFIKAGAKEKDIIVYEAEPSKSSFNSASDAVSYLHTKGEDFDCIFACSDWRAYGALIALNNMHLRVPEDIKLIGYDGILISHYSQLPLTTIQQNPDMLAASSVDTLMALMEGKRADETTLIPVQVQKGDTV